MSRRSRRRDADLEDFRRDDSVYSDPVRRQLYTWPGEGLTQPSSGTLPRPFVKSVDYEPDSDSFVPLRSSVAPSAVLFQPWGTPPSQASPARRHGRSGLTLRSLLRPVFSGSKNPCESRGVRREVMFAIGAGGARLGTKKVRRTSNSERSC